MNRLSRARPAVATIIDAHCHAGPGDGFTGPWDTSAPLDDYLRRCDEAGIGRSNLLAAFHSDYRVANEEVGRIVASDPGRFTAFAFVNAERDRGQVHSLVRRAVVGLGFCGIKVHRHDARLSREICDVARLFRLPILYDVMGEVAAAELFATEYPDVNFIIPHLGSFADDWSAQLAFTSLLADHPNLFTDTSGVRRFDVLVKAVRRAGPGKVLFGTDGPWLHPGLELEKVRLLKLPPEAESLVLAGNFLRLTEPVRRRQLRSSGLLPSPDRARRHT
ncbi:amidohydrolase family protein [Kribbella sp. NPDC051952]|uniref:amidohydrolase family protein n=1 Tax=Kribbella sp. NPDC051952 TaxID=3154851 RepID=UPI0034445C67